MVGCEQVASAPASNEFILLATTTSTYDSGLLDYMLPAFEEKYGIEVRVLPKGTGQALELGKGGDVDVLLVHDRSSELKMVEEGFFVDRYDVMFNDFIIVGPTKDPAGIKEIDEVKEALKAIIQGNHTFISRGDNSGTHSMELSLWEAAGISNFGEGYKSVGQGMGDTLRITDEQEGYTLTDRATYIALKETLEVDILLEGDQTLFNQYGIMAVNPKKHSHNKYESALKLIEFFMSEEGQQMITDYKLQGEVLFFPGMCLKY
ncbi:substrate-binding domain-containing protein [Candidatus Contubernalis alkalaceticus]|nr:substrate-binding domain-containing protein [Candidatus Contubernalis alkalaceticus]